MAPSNPRRDLSRRRFLRGSVAAAALTAVGPLESLATPRWQAIERWRWRRDGGLSTTGGDYGPLAPTADLATGLPLLQLPEGFVYTSFGWTGDPQSDGTLTPDRHDGMACFGGRGHRYGTLQLIRNHEREAGTPISAEAPTYDAAAGGGTTNLFFDPRTGALRRSRVSLAGTIRNCAGGTTPWGTWISCEETRDGPGNGALEQEHGFCFEVPVRRRASARPLRAMGRFAHEAIAFEPSGRAAYLTEDAGASGLYRFRPNRRRRLDSGVLEMLAVRDTPRFVATRDLAVGERVDVDWVPIALPDPPGPRAAVDANSCHSQGRALGGATFSRLEGIDYDRGHVWFTSTNGGAARRGQIFDLDVRAQTLRLAFESSGAAELDFPDNLAAHPSGALIVCEDGGGTDRLLGFTPDGLLFPFAVGNVVLAGERGFIGDFTSSEFAGACWSPNGRWLFVNVQSPGITLAITGPWARGGFAPGPGTLAARGRPANPGSNPF